MLGLGLRLSKNNKSKNNIQVNSVKNTFVNSYRPDKNYAQSSIELYNGGDSDSLYGLLYFDLDMIIGKKIESANLKLYAINLPEEINIFSKIITSSWIESEVTYDTKPTLSEEIYSLGSVSPGSDWKIFDVKNIMQDISNGAIYQGLWLYVENLYKWCEFSSKELPTLEISYGC
jgi:hypothetical protein